jgi:glucose-6-phosphate 1-dehydrogenase
MSENNALVIFGATGDLCFNKLLPAIAQLNQDHPDSIRTVFLVGRQVQTREAYFALAEEKGLSLDTIVTLVPKLTYVYMQAGDSEDYGALSDVLQPYQGRYFYVATPPTMYWVILESLVDRGLLVRHQANHRIAFEKPFGEDGAAADVLVRLMTGKIEENQLFRVDHYLAKPMIQALVPLRQRMKTLASLFQAPTLKYVTLKAFETLGILSRGKFYEATGAMNDMIQSHLLLTLTQAIAPLNAQGSIEPAEFLKGLSVNPSSIKLGQYMGYRDEVHVNPASTTETFAAFSLSHHDPALRGIDFWIMTGKKCSEKRTDIVFYFAEDAWFRIKIAPDIGMTYNAAFKALCSPAQLKELTQLSSLRWTQKEGYETIFSEFIAGNTRLFPSSDAILASWNIMEQAHRHAPLPKPYHHENDVLEGVVIHETL